MTIPGILKDCARKSSSGNLTVALAEQYLAADEWGSAVRTIQDLLNKKPVENDGKPFWILGHAYLKQGQVKLARSAFEKAAGFEKYRLRVQQSLNTLGQDCAP